MDNLSHNGPNRTAQPMSQVGISVPFDRSRPWVAPQHFKIPASARTQMPNLPHIMGDHMVRQATTSQLGVNFGQLEENGLTNDHNKIQEIAKLCIIPVLCLFEVLFDKFRYSIGTKLSIMVVLFGVGVCTVSDVSVNTKGLAAAAIAVWSTSLQQYFGTVVSLQGMLKFATVFKELSNYKDLLRIQLRTRNLGEIHRARAIFVFSSNDADPRSDLDFWNKRRF